MKNIVFFFILSITFISCTTTTTDQKVVEVDSSAGFVQVNNSHFEINGKPYYYLGTNFWYGLNLGADTTGGRERLVRELDRLQSLKINNLRIVGLSEGPDNQPYRMLPAVQNEPGIFDEDVLKGLDFLLAEMGKRDMYAVVTLGNFWPWSGGFGQYLIWSGAADSIPYPPPHPGGNWDTYQKFTAQFYSDTTAVKLYRNAVSYIVGRKNTVTGRDYKNDPTIMAWQLCNEPRGMNNTVVYNQWVDSTAALIKSLDSNHLVSAGTEGYTSDASYSGVDVNENHNGKYIDYVTCHVWVENWGWYDPKRNIETYDSSVSKMKGYFRKHVEAAEILNKPLVLEEFGIARDRGSYDPNAFVTTRNMYYETVFQEIYNYASQESPVVGVNFWAWAGEGRPAKPGTLWQKGDDFTGDPPHEYQGWYSVYDKDSSTHVIIKNYAEMMNSL